MNRWAVAFGVSFCVGCQAPRGPVSIKSDDPDLKIQAIRNDGCSGSRRDLAALVADLSSDDPAIRFYSIEALHRITHDNFGYHYYETDEERAPATLLWQKWLKQQPN